jgi:hypothetical protein
VAAATECRGVTNRTTERLASGMATLEKLSHRLNGLDEQKEIHDRQ